MKYIFVTGGVLSSLGKGLFCGSLASLLEMHGYKVKMQKFDPYFNTDPSIMSPYQHGEIYILKDGAHTDLDLGHYERFTNSTFTAINSVSSGQIYKQVIENGEKGVYGGSTVQVIPHVTNEIIRCLKRGGEECDITVTELGGTIGDIEGLPFLEAFRQFQHEVGHENCIFIMLSYVPYLKSAKEIKTKPTQQAVAKLREIGIQPDIIVTRSDVEIGEDNRRKLGFYCSVDTIIEEVNVSVSIYEIPIILQKQSLDVIVLQKLKMFTGTYISMHEWINVYNKLANPSRIIKLAICGQYLDHFDAHKSTYEAISHAGICNDCKLEHIKIDPATIEAGTSISELISECSGMIIPDGFGDYGLEGMISVIKYCRENQVKLFAYGLGMQLMVIEFCRNVLGIAGACSQEFPLTEEPYFVFSRMEDFKVQHHLGSERIGHFVTLLDEGSVARRAYGSKTAIERHRYFFEVNFDIMARCEESGLKFSGKTQDLGFGDVCEVEGHPFMVGAIYRPQFYSKPMKANPMFTKFVTTLLE